MSAASEVISAKVTRTLDLPPSCAQFCPMYLQYFVVGTYSLNQEEASDDAGAEQAQESGGKAQSRDGSLVVFKTDGNDLCVHLYAPFITQTYYEMDSKLVSGRKHVQTLMHPSAILDLRFHGGEETQNVLAVVSSTGTLAIFRLSPESADSPLQHITTSRCEDIGDDVLFLQCQWHPRDLRVLGVTTSTGQAKLLRLNEHWQIERSIDVNIGNSLEAWCIEFSPTLPGDGPDEATTVYCGGDDSILRFTSCSLGSDSDFSAYEQTYSPATIKGYHNAGVTAILSLPLFDNTGGRLVVTGSYDDHVRLFSIQDLHRSHGIKRVQLLAEGDLDGGVWRLDLTDLEHLEGSRQRIRILASCMYAGARLIEFRTDMEGAEWECHVLGRFEEHTSMNYACCVSLGGQGNSYISTSFYDKRLCLWDY